MRDPLSKVIKFAINLPYIKIDSVQSMVKDPRIHKITLNL